MPEFLIALLVVGTVFLLLGLIGRGVEAGSGMFTFKIEGKVGPFPRVVFASFGAIDYVIALVLFLALLGSSKPTPPQGGNKTPVSASITSPATSPATSSTTSQPELSAGQIAHDAIGETETRGVNTGATVTNATCYQDTVQQNANFTTQAECDLTLSNGVILRAAVTDNGSGSTTSENQYQENLTASDIANAVYGDVATDGLTVRASTCYQNTLQIENNGYAQVQCNLTFSNGSTYYDTVTYNGLSAPSF